MTSTVLRADAGRLPLDAASVDLVFTSPPYADARTYGIGAQRGCLEWVEWMLGVLKELQRVCRGPVLVNAAGVTRDRNYWPTCEGLMWEWWKLGGDCQLYRPCFWHRVGIPGSGGKDWLRADVEYVMCFKRPGKLAWSDNTANGHPPKWAPGGEMAHRLSNGARVNQCGHPIGSGGTEGSIDNVTCGKPRPSHKFMSMSSRGSNGERKMAGGRSHTKSLADGSDEEQVYIPPTLANPGNLIKGIKVGGGLMGHKLAHENEAPFPVKLAEWFIRSHCPPGGTVLDPFCGSGTTAHAAVNLGRGYIVSDIRESQVELTRRRLADVGSATEGKPPKPRRLPLEATLFTMEAST